MTMLTNYFDIGIFYIIKGYLTRFFDRLDETETVNVDELKTSLMTGFLLKKKQQQSKQERFNDIAFDEAIRLGIIT